MPHTRQAGSSRLLSVRSAIWHAHDSKGDQWPKEQSGIKQVWSMQCNCHSCTAMHMCTSLTPVESTVLCDSMQPQRPPYLLLKMLAQHR